MKRSLAVLFLSLVTGLLVLHSCKANKDELINPTDSCDSLAVSYSRTIVPILEANCYRCHREASSWGAPKLDTYAGLKEQADKGSLVGTITYSSGYNAMPRSAAKLDDCTIGKIRNWVKAGALNN